MNPNYRNKIGEELLSLYNVDGINLDYYAMMHNRYIIDMLDGMQYEHIILKARKNEVSNSCFIHGVHEILHEHEHEHEHEPVWIREEAINLIPPTFRTVECIVLRVYGIKKMVDSVLRSYENYQQVLWYNTYERRGINYES